MMTHGKIGCVNATDSLEVTDDRFTPLSGKLLRILRADSKLTGQGG